VWTTPTFFCRPEQVTDEILRVIQLTRHVYDFGSKGYQAYIATRPEKYLGTLEMWNLSRKRPFKKRRLQPEGLDYKLDEGEGVSYGPKKIDSKVKDSWQRMATWNNPVRL